LRIGEHDITDCPPLAMMRRNPRSVLILHRCASVHCNIRRKLTQSFAIASPYFAAHDCARGLSQMTKVRQIAVSQPEPTDDLTLRSTAGPDVREPGVMSDVKEAPPSLGRTKQKGLVDGPSGKIGWDIVMLVTLGTTLALVGIALLVVGSLMH
jgi:hypothetical protein